MAWPIFSIFHKSPRKGGIIKTEQLINNISPGTIILSKTQVKPLGIAMNSANKGQTVLVNLFAAPSEMPEVYGKEEVILGFDAERGTFINYNKMANDNFLKRLIANIKKNRSR